MKIRQFVMRAVGAAAVATAAVMGGAGLASASPSPAPQWFTLGNVVPLVGQNAWCNGIVDVFVETDPVKPPQARYSKLTPAQPN